MFSWESNQGRRTALLFSSVLKEKRSRVFSQMKFLLVWRQNGVQIDENVFAVDKTEFVRGENGRTERFRVDAPQRNYANRISRLSRLASLPEALLLMKSMKIDLKLSLISSEVTFRLSERIWLVVKVCAIGRRRTWHSWNGLGLSSYRNFTNVPVVMLK